MLFPLNRGPLADTASTLNGWAVTSWFGGRLDPLTGRAGNHGGMDLAFSGCNGQPMLAVGDGWVTQSWDSSGGGNWSGLTLTNGDYWGYGHAQAFEPVGGRNRAVKAGDVIGYVGTTGGSTGPHLHIAYRPKGSVIYRDPYDQLAAASGAGAPTPQPPEEPDVTEDEIIKAVTKALDGRPAAPPSAAHQVVQLGDVLWLVLEDGDGNLRRRWIQGPAELAMLQQIGTAYSGPWVNITPDTELAFRSLPAVDLPGTPY